MQLKPVRRKRKRGEVPLFDIMMRLLISGVLDKLTVL
jgi:hypothetical protein